MGFLKKLVNGGLGRSGGLKGLVEEVSEKTSSGKKIMKENSIWMTTAPAHGAAKAYDTVKSKNKKYATLPAFGAPIYCHLGPVEHSGIYVGDKKVVQLNGKGRIEKVSLSNFTGHVTTVDTAIWFPCDNESGYALGLGEAGNRALEMLGNKRNYNILLDNCHQFSSGCLTGDFENADNFLWTLKHTFEQKLHHNVFWKRGEW